MYRISDTGYMIHFPSFDQRRINECYQHLVRIISGDDTIYLLEIRRYINQRESNDITGYKNTVFVIFIIKIVYVTRLFFNKIGKINRFYRNLYHRYNTRNYFRYQHLCATHLHVNRKLSNLHTRSWSRLIIKADY